MTNSKKRVIKSLDTLGDDLKELLRRQYPNGYDEYITRIMSAKKEPIFVFPLETEDSIYLVKVPATKNSSGGYDVDKAEEDEFSDDDSDDYGNNDNLSGSGDSEDFDENEEGKKTGKEASYDPDFDG